MIQITKVARCIIMGKAVLMGRDAAGKDIFGISVKPESVVKWSMNGVARSDLKRVQKAYLDYQKECELVERD